MGGKMALPACYVFSCRSDYRHEEIEAKSMRQPVLIVLLAVIGNGQTRVDLASQGRNIDFSRAASTKPFKTGAVLPVTCSLNEVFLETDNAGNTLYSCSIPNQWSQVTSGQSVSPLTFS